MLAGLPPTSFLLVEVDCEGVVVDGLDAVGVYQTEQRKNEDKQLKCALDSQ